MGRAFDFMACFKIADLLNTGIHSLFHDDPAETPVRKEV
jgi:hypothetical protein